MLPVGVNVPVDWARALPGVFKSPSSRQQLTVISRISFYFLLLIFRVPDGARNAVRPGTGP